MKLATSSIIFASLTTSALSTVTFDRRQDRQYPAQYEVPDTSMTPQAWTDAYNAVKAQGKIAGIPPSTMDQNGNINYPDNLNNDPGVCSWTTIKCYGPNDIYKAPTNVLGVAFDDGPTAASHDLYSFLDQNDQSSTHFLIGTNILNYPDSIKQANEEGNQQFAVHTWSHTVQTTLTDEQVVAELGWTMQIIYDMTGKIPSLWRPPQGDVDNRVRGIAENVFGLTTVLWNKDSNDWCINDDGSSSCPGENPGETDQSVGEALEGFIHDNVNQEEGIIILEHELTSHSVQHFKNYYPELSGLGWDPKAIAEIDGRAWYSNSNNGTSPTTNQTNMVAASAINPLSSSSSSTSSSSRSTSTSTLTSTSTQPPRSTKTAIVIQTPVNQLKSHTNASQKRVMPLTLLLSSLLVSLLI